MAGGKCMTFNLTVVNLFVHETCRLLFNFRTEYGGQ